MVDETKAPTRLQGHAKAQVVAALLLVERAHLGGRVLSEYDTVGWLGLRKLGLRHLGLRQCVSHDHSLLVQLLCTFINPQSSVGTAAGKLVRPSTSSGSGQAG